MDIRVLVFNSGTFNRRDLSKMTEKELYDLWNADETAQVQMYHLDEFSCAFNDEEVSSQDWLYFVDFDNVKEESEPEKVWVLGEHYTSDWSDDCDVILGAFDSLKKAEKAADDIFDEVMANHPEWDKEDDSKRYAVDPNGWSMGHISLTIEECEIK